MITNKKGLSTVVTMLIIVLLSLAAIGLIWNPVKDLLSSSTDSLDQTKCLNVDIRATKVVNTTEIGDAYDVTLKRESSGTATEEFGAKIIFFNDTANSEVVDFGDYLLAPEVSTQSITGITNTVVGANKVEVTPYYVSDETGEEKLCSNPTTFEWTN